MLCGRVSRPAPAGWVPDPFLFPAFQRCHGAVYALSFIGCCCGGGILPAAGRTPGAALEDGVIRIDVRRKAFGKRRSCATSASRWRSARRSPSSVRRASAKSTLLRLVAGIDTAFDGEITRPETIAMVFQEPVLLPVEKRHRESDIGASQLGMQAALSALERTASPTEPPLFPGQCRSASSAAGAGAGLCRSAGASSSWTSPMCRSIPAMAEDMLALTEGADRRKTAPAVILVTIRKPRRGRACRRCLRLAGKPATIIEEFAGRAGRAS